MTTSKLLTLCALVCFILACVGIAGPVNLVALGLAFMAGSGLV